MAINESGEMYLESIYVLCKKNGQVRSVDIAEHMNYSKPSISRGVGILKDEGCIVVDDDGYITLTEKGEQIAQTIFEKHTVLTSILEKLGVDPETASADACKIEHVISEKSFDAIKKYFENQ